MRYVCVAGRAVQADANAPVGSMERFAHISYTQARSACMLATNAEYGLHCLHNTVRPDPNLLFLSSQVCGHGDGHDGDSIVPIAHAHLEVCLLASCYAHTLHVWPIVCCEDPRGLHTLPRTCNVAPADFARALNPVSVPGQGAENIVLDGVLHKMAGKGIASADHQWYGSEGVIDQWLPHLAQ